ncbi:MAG: hypothetical protein JRH16_03230 [Deltaproteobacteria bacterium]|nr:hypothetical protein [Deltaproteobacteria bacterium]MBW2363003.1 hypothetical protein [Deltaproteobacteria bacterium]
MRCRTLLAVLIVVAGACLPGCYTASALRQSERVLSSGFDFDGLGPWVLISGPGSMLVAGGVLAVGSMVPLGDGVDPREPMDKWFHSYAGAMRAPEEVGVLCHQDVATWVTGIRGEGSAAWGTARHEKWHFPVCLEALPGRHELEVHYYAREHDDDQDLSVSRQAESTHPSVTVWEATAGQVDALVAVISAPQPAAGAPPQRHIPHSRALGTTWWELQESSWSVRIDSLGAWGELEGPVQAQRNDWAEWEGRR